MTLYTPSLVSLDYVRSHRRLETTETTDDALLVQFIAEASADFQSALQRTCMPYVATKKFAPSNLRNSVELVLRDDLLAVTTVTNASGATVSSSVYNLRPDNVYPKNIVEITTQSGTYWDFSYIEDRVQIAGIWGYVPHYAQNAWKSLTTLSSAITTTGQSTLQVPTVAGVSVGDYLLIGSEQVFVTASDGGATTETLTIDRSANGTTAATHLSGAAVSVFQQLADIKMAVREMVVWLYLTKDQIGGSVQVFDGGTVQVQGLDPNVQKTLARHQRRQAILGV